MFDSLSRTVALNPSYSAETGSSVDESLFQTFSSFNDSYVAIEELLQETNTINDLEHFKDTIVSYGVTKSLLAFANRDQLLSSTMPVFGACESLNIDVVVGSPKAIAAVEALSGTIKDLVAGWFKKAWDTLVSFSQKIGSFTKAVLNKTLDVGKAIKNKTFNALKAAKETVKAHPIATAVGAIALVGSITVLLSFLWGLPLPLTPTALTSWSGTVRNKILNVVGSHGFKVDGGLDITYPPGYGIVETGTPKLLGYSGETGTSLVLKAQETFKEGSPFSRLGETMPVAAKNLFDTAKKSGPGGLNFAQKALAELIRITKFLWSFLTSKAVSVISSSLSLIRNLFKSNSSDNSSDNSMNNKALSGSPVPEYLRLT